MSPSVRHLSVPCDHRGGAFGYDHHDEVRNVEVEYIRCMCGETLPPRPSQRLRRAGAGREGSLADVLAEAHTGEWTIDGLDVDDLEGGAIDAWLDMLEQRLEVASRPRRPRSPIEVMVDQACGHTHDQEEG